MPHKVFNEIVAWDDKIPEYGIVDFGEEAIIESLSDGSEISCSVSFSRICVFSKPLIAFYDYYKKNIGAFDVVSGNLIWSRPSSRDRLSLLFVGAIRENGYVIYQVGEKITFLDANTGECMETRKFEGEVVGMGEIGSFQSVIARVLLIVEMGKLSLVGKMVSVLFANLTIVWLLWSDRGRRGSYLFQNVDCYLK